MSTSETIERQHISQEEIDWVRSKHDGLQKTARRMLKEAIEIGQWFVEAEAREGRKKGARGGTWYLWLAANFPEIPSRTISRYMQLARGQEFLERNGGLTTGDLTISKALRLLQARDRKTKPMEEPPAVFEEPLQLLANELKSYVWQMYQVKALEAKIQVRIKTAKLSRRQIRQAVEWATREHLEVKEVVLKAFLQ